MRSVLCLGGGVHHKIAIIVQLLEPAGNVGGLILVMQSLRTLWPS